LRIEDNTGLRIALEMSESVIPCFIFTEHQIGKENSYRSMHAIQYMVESLQDLAHSLKKLKRELYIFQGEPHTIVEQLIRTESLKAVYVNRDYTPYSRKRDSLIEEICATYKIDFHSSPDSLLLEPEAGLSPQGTSYKVFTPFFKKNQLLSVAEPIYHTHQNFASELKFPSISLSFLETLVPHKADLYAMGGRARALKNLEELKLMKNYAHLRDNLANNTSGFSAHNKFGTVSIRELYYAISRSLGKESGMLRQLYWRDFFTHIAWFNPRVFGHAFQEKFEHIPWNTNKNDFTRWCEGTTGFPVVDAGMRQLNATGFMHNRARLIVGSFLVKDLHISWLWGEKYFAQQLTDYDPSVNNGNWQWVASTGCDAQPYFRIFNPWLQQNRFDPECIYIKQWIPELRNLDPKIIHTWYKQMKPIGGYPVPMVDHTRESQKTKELYKQAAASYNE
jgi:deoxyribodipyrimidine photo-lyase